jgi:hypothetical protein
MARELGHVATIAAPGGHGLGDALWMLRRAGLDGRRLSPADRSMVADAEARCMSCPVTGLCGAFLARRGDRDAGVPAFCPNAALFRELRREAHTGVLRPSAFRHRPCEPKGAPARR